MQLTGEPTGFGGVVEEVDSGKQFRFHSWAELEQFLVQRREAQCYGTPWEAEKNQGVSKMMTTMITGAALTTEDRTAIHQAIEEMILGWNRHDMRQCMSPFADDADFVNVLGTHFRGVEQIYASHLQIHKTFMRNSTLEVQDVSLRPAGAEAAIAHLRWEMKGMEPVPGWNQPGIRHGLMTLVFLRVDGRWRITAAHNTDEVRVEGQPLPAGGGR